MQGLTVWNRSQSGPTRWPGTWSASSLLGMTRPPAQTRMLASRSEWEIDGWLGAAAAMLHGTDRCKWLVSWRAIVSSAAAYMFLSTCRIWWFPHFQYPFANAMLHSTGRSSATQNTWLPILFVWHLSLTKSPLWMGRCRAHQVRWACMIPRLEGRAWFAQKRYCVQICGMFYSAETHRWKGARSQPIISLRLHLPSAAAGGRPSLAFFRGSDTAAGISGVRQDILTAFANDTHSDVGLIKRVARLGNAAYLRAILQSTFCPSPRGHSGWSMR